MKDSSVKPLVSHLGFEPLEIINNIPLEKRRKLLGESHYRWIALVLSNIMIVGGFFALEGPQPIETEIQKQLKIDEEQYSVLYSSWALPSIFSPILGGYLIDRIGVRSTLVLFSVIVTIGQFIYTYGGAIFSFNWMLFGRSVYAIGVDPLNIGQIVLINKWFYGKELAFAIGISGSTIGIARALNSLITPMLFNLTNTLVTPMLFGSALCLFGTVITLILMKWDKQEDESEVNLNPKQYYQSESSEKISFKDLKHFSPMVWLLILTFGLVYGCSYSFNAFTNDIYQVRYGFNNVQAGEIISSNFIVMSIAAIVFGKLVDMYGYRAFMIMFNSLLGFAAFLYFFMFPKCFGCLSSMIPQILFGLQLGISEAAIFPSLPLVLGERYLGTGYGLFFVLENVLVLVLPLIGAHIKETTMSTDNDGYFGMIVFYFVWSCILVGISVRLFLEDLRNNRTLDRKSSVNDKDSSRIMDEVSMLSE